MHVSSIDGQTASSLGTAAGERLHPLGFGRVVAAALAAVALAASTLLTQPAVARADASLSVDAPSPSAESSFEQRIVYLVNQDRSANGLSPVTFDPALLTTARERAADQVAQPVLNHYDGSGQLEFLKLLSREGVAYSAAGENLARMDGLVDGIDDGTAMRAENALMRSPTHRANILDPSYNRIAVGAMIDGEGRIVLAQIFSAT